MDLNNTDKLVLDGFLNRPREIKKVTRIEKSSVAKLIKEEMLIVVQTRKNGRKLVVITSAGKQYIKSRSRTGEKL